MSTSPRFIYENPTELTPDEAAALPLHDLASVFPPMHPTDEWPAFKANIRAHGVQQRAVLHRGKLLDGRHRRRASVKLGTQLPVHSLPDDADPAVYVEAKNLHRRSLRLEQKAHIVVRLHQWRDRGHRKQMDHDGPSAPTNAELAKMAGVSPSTIKRAKAMEREGHGECILAGRTTYSQVRKDEAHPLMQAMRVLTIHGVMPDDIDAFRADVDAIDMDKDDEATLEYLEIRLLFRMMLAHRIFCSSLRPDQVATASQNLSIYRDQLDVLVAFYRKTRRDEDAEVHGRTLTELAELDQRWIDAPASTKEMT